MKTNIENFINYDLSIKKDLDNIGKTINGYPREEDLITFSDAMLDYTDKFENIFLKINKYAEVVEDITLSNFFTNMKNKILYTSLKEKDLKLLYEECFWTTNAKIFSTIDNTFIGYLLQKPDVNYIVEQSTSINELLHLFHTSIFNNEIFYQELPITYQSTSISGETINLRGEYKEGATLLVNSLSHIDVGETNICCFKDEIFMMIRDRGHALTIVINELKDTYYINYHIPKLINLDMIENLEGITDINEELNSANGSLMYNKEDLIEKLTTFINSVPTDFDYYKGKSI